MTDQTRVDTLLLRYEELRAQGKSITPDELCRACPELREQVERELQVLESMNALLGGPENHTSASAGLHAAAPAAAPPMEEALSTSLRYRILRFHAKGGLGEVHVARDEMLHREVALKRLQPLHARNRMSRSRFLREAEITSRLEHPNIAPVHAVGQDADGRPFYAMRFVQGETLHDAIARFHAIDKPGGDPGERRLTLRQLLGKLVAVCNTVAYAHSRGIVHRDLKPSNILLGAYGETLVVDWGLAKAGVRGRASEGIDQGPEVSSEQGRTGQESDDASAERPAEQAENAIDPWTPPATEIGSAIGTPSYMSPEQAEGRWDHVACASDIYSLGATLYALLAGCAPFEGRQVGEVLDKVKRGIVQPPRRFKKEIPAALEAICLKAMAREPDRRYATALAMAGDLEHWLADEPVSAWREPWTVRARRWVGRHRTLVTALVATVFVAFISLATATGLLRAAQEREHRARMRAEDNYRLAREAVDGLYTEVSENVLLNEPDMESVRTRLLHKARDFYEKLTAHEDADSDAQAERGRTYLRLARIVSDISTKTEAIQLLQEASAIFERLVSAHPSVADYRRESAKSLDLQSGLHRQIGQAALAEELARRSLSIREELVRTEANTPDDQDALLRAHLELAVLSREADRLNEAGTQLAKALQIGVLLSRTYPNSARYQRSLAEVHNSLGIWHRARGNSREMEAEVRVSLDIWEKLLQADPKVVATQRKVAQEHYNLGIFYLEHERPAEAEASFERARALRETLVRAHPSVSHFRSELAKCYYGLGKAQANSGRPSEAEANSRKSLALLEELVRGYPNVPDYRLNLGLNLEHLGDLLKTTNPQTARDWYEDALCHYQALLEQRASLALVHERLVHVHSGRADILEQSGRHAEALQELDQALRYASGKYRGYVQMNRALRLAQLGRHAEASAEADEVTRQTRTIAVLQYGAACVYSLCSTAVRKDAALDTLEKEERAQKYASEAVQRLVRAEALGYFKAPDKVERLKIEQNLDPLRSREDFRNLIRAVTEKAGQN